MKYQIGDKVVIRTGLSDQLYTDSVSGAQDYFIDDLQIFAGQEVTIKAIVWTKSGYGKWPSACGEKYTIVEDPAGYTFVDEMFEEETE